MTLEERCRLAFLHGVRDHQERVGRPLTHEGSYDARSRYPDTVGSRLESAHPKIEVTTETVASNPTVGAAKKPTCMATPTARLSCHPVPGVLLPPDIANKTSPTNQPAASPTSQPATTAATPRAGSVPLAKRTTRMASAWMNG